MNVELYIQNGENIYQPIVESGVNLEWERKSTPGKLTFSLKKDDIINFQEGNTVSLTVDGVRLFYGFVFQKQRNKKGIITVVAYDQLRYLKNKDTISYENLTATGLIKRIADDYRLECGELEDTGIKRESRYEDNQTLFDIIQNALDFTLEHRGVLYVLYDDFGKLSLKNIESMKLDLLIDSETGQNFDYTSSIDGSTYNRIKLQYDNEETGFRDTYIAQDSNRFNEWGILQYFEKINEEVNGKAKADALLLLYNQKTRNLTINDAFGDLRVRAGSSIAVSLDIGDIVINNSYMVVEKVTHKFKESFHTMDLNLRGGGGVKYVG